MPKSHALNVVWILILEMFHGFRQVVNNDRGVHISILTPFCDKEVKLIGSIIAL